MGGVVRVARLLSAAVLAAASVTGGLVAIEESPASAASGSVAGLVFEDYDLDGVLDPASTTAAVDRGVAGAAVAVTDSTGALVGSTVTDANGAFSIAGVTAATAAVRVTVTPPTGYTTGPVGPDSGSTVQFVQLGSAEAADVGVGLTRQGDYAPAAPRIIVPHLVAAFTDNLTLLTTPLTSLFSVGYRGVNPVTAEATSDQTGAIWGAAQLGARYAFTAASLRRHARTGPGGMGAIYLTDLDAGPNATPWATIPDVGSVPRPNESTMTAFDWAHDPAYSEIGTTGLGSLVMAPDQRSLFVVSLTTKTLWRIPFTIGGGGVPVAGTPVAAAALPLGLPGAAVGCADPGQVRPFGVAAQNGSLWVTITCTGPTAADLRGYVYRGRGDGSSFDAAPAFELSLNYPRGEINGPAHPAAWRPWIYDDTWPAINTTVISRLQPLLTDVAFDANGDMTVVMKDRFADMTGPVTYNPDPADTVVRSGRSGGDILRACVNGAGAYVLESNGSCGSRVGALVGSNEGPGGGAFYNDRCTCGHDHIDAGGLLQVPGYAEVTMVGYDVDNNIFDQGIRMLSNSNGAHTANRVLVGNVNGTFRKSGGLGDVAALVAAAPVEIGNRVWLDADSDGVQDAGEAPVAGATVHLYAADGTTVLATAVTDAAGTYYFSSAAGASTASAIRGVAGLAAASSYVVRVDNPADFATGGPLAGYIPTTPHLGGNPAVDSNGVVGAGGFSTAAVTTGPEGASDDHTIDFGFRRPASYTACRGSGLRLGVLTLAVANEPISPCVSADPAFPPGLNFGSVPLPGVVGGLLGALLPAGSLGFNVDGLDAMSYNEGPDRMRADADVVRAQITLPGINLGISTIRAEASATLQPGCTTVLDGMSRIGLVTLNGVPLVAGITTPVTIPLGIATLYLNQRVVTGNTVTHRAVFLDLPGTALDLTIGEAIAGIAC